MAVIFGSMMVYHGSKMSQAEFDSFHIRARNAPWNSTDGQFRVPKFVAASTSVAQASGFTSTRVLIHINVPRECRNIGSLVGVSVANQEEEYLIPPYSVFTAIMKYSYTPENGQRHCVLVVKLTDDNKKHSNLLPTLHF